jgi:hypothetical protein
MANSWSKWTGHTVYCGRCREYETKWIDNRTGVGVCKYCHVEVRGTSAPVPAYLKEVIPLE